MEEPTRPKGTPMNRPLALATAVLAAGAMIVGATGCSLGGEEDPTISTTPTQAPATVTEQTTVTEQEQQQNQDDQNQNQDDQNQNQDQSDQAEGEAIGNAAEGAGLSEAKKECLANAPSAADCANIP